MFSMAVGYDLGSTGQPGEKMLPLDVGRAIVLLKVSPRSNNLSRLVAVALHSPIKSSFLSCPQPYARAAENWRHNDRDLT